VGRGALQSLFKAFGEFGQGKPNSSADLTQFQQIQSPFARFELAYEGLWLAEFFGQVYLPQAGSKTNLAQKLLERILFRAEDAFFHEELTNHH
jgi:hypothetical protein